jgi:TrmH family RNA methyltransferase
MRFLLYSTGLGSRGETIIREQKSKGVDVEQVQPDLLGSLGETETSQGLLAVLELRELGIPPTPDFLLVLDRIRDPGSGTLLRTADAAGVQAVLAPETADAFAPKAVRAGMGAHFRLPIRALTRSRSDRYQPVCRFSWRTCRANLLGDRPARSAGVDRRRGGPGAGRPARQLAHRKISIPMAGHTESLNAGVAGSVLMYEIKRQDGNLIVLAAVLALEGLFFDPAHPRGQTHSCAYVAVVQTGRLDAYPDERHHRNGPASAANMNANTIPIH